MLWLVYKVLCHCRKGVLLTARSLQIKFPTPQHPNLHLRTAHFLALACPRAAPLRPPNLHAMSTIIAYIDPQRGKDVISAVDVQEVAAVGEVAEVEFVGAVEGGAVGLA